MFCGKRMDRNKKKKKAAIPLCYVCIITQDEKNWLWYSLKSVYDFADQIIIVDGNPKSNITPNILSHFPKDKIVYIPKPYTKLNDQRNAYWEYIENHDPKPDYAMYLDSDEVFKHNELKLIKEKYLSSLRYDIVRVKSYHFWKDSCHIITGGHWEKSYLMNRFVKWEKGLGMRDWIPKMGDHELMLNGKYYLSDNSILMQAGEESLVNNRKLILLPENIRCYHYGHARGLEDKVRKIKFFLEYDFPEIPKSEWNKTIRNDTWFTGETKGVISFKGTHPEVMKKHPLCNKKHYNA